MIPFRVLFICIGNVCRSPMGEGLLAQRLPAEEFEISSAGVRALAGQGMSPHVATLLTSYGGNPDGFISRHLNTDILLDSDLNLTATTELRSEVLAEWPGALRRTFTVREFAALLDVVDSPDPLELVSLAAAHRSEVAGIDYDIPDPFRRGEQAHLLAADLMYAAVDRIAKGLK